MAEVNKEVCYQIIDRVYNEMYSDDILILQRFEKFLDVASRWGCYNGWDIDNLFLLLDGYPDAADLRTKEKWLSKNINVDPEAIPVKFLTDSDVFDLYDISQTDADKTGKNSDIPVLDIDVLVRSMYVIFSVFNRYLVAYVPHEIYGTDIFNSWTRLGRTELGERVILFRKDPNDVEKRYAELTNEKLDSDKCKYFKCRWMINCYLQAYYMGHNYTDLSIEDLDDDEYTEMVYFGDVLADLIFHRFGIYQGHEIVNYPSIYNGKKPDISEFKKATSDMLSCYKSLALSIEKLADYYRNKLMGQ